MKFLFLFALVFSFPCFGDSMKPFMDFTEKWEGRRNHVYVCSEGHKTIGVGHKLKHYEQKLTYIPDNIVDAFFEDDILFAYHGAKRSVKNFDSLPFNVKLIVVDMVFNLGEAGFQSFEKAILACNNNDFVTMALELRDSKWFNQVGNRSKNHFITLLNLE